MSENVNIDDALVEEVARVIAAADWGDPNAQPVEDDRRIARAVLAHLAPRLLPAGGEERVEWGVRWIDEIDGPGYTREQAVAQVAQHTDPDDPGAVIARTVRTHTAPDGTVATIVGPWREVEGG